MPVDDTPGDQLGHDAVKVPVGGKKYKVGILEFGDFVAFEARLREQRHSELKDLLPLVTHLDALETARLLNTILATPFTKDDVKQNMETPTGSAWIVERVISRHNPGFTLDGLGPLEVAELATAIAARSGLTGGDEENPTEPSSVGEE